MNRVLKKGGLLISFFFSKNHTEYKNKTIKRILLKLLKKRRILMD